MTIVFVVVVVVFIFAGLGFLIREFPEWEIGISFHRSEFFWTAMSTVATIATALVVFLGVIVVLE